MDHPHVISDFIGLFWPKLFTVFFPVTIINSIASIRILEAIWPLSQLIKLYNKRILPFIW